MKKFDPNDEDLVLLVNWVAPLAISTVAAVLAGIAWGLVGAVIVFLLVAFISELGLAALLFGPEVAGAKWRDSLSRLGTGEAPDNQYDPSIGDAGNPGPRHPHFMADKVDPNSPWF